MGEPATPTPAELAATLELARRIVEAVRDDEESPLDRVYGGTSWSERLRLETFRLAQAMTIALDERDRARRERDVFSYDSLTAKYNSTRPIVDAANCPGGREHER